MITNNPQQFWSQAAKQKDWRKFILPGRTEAEFWQEGETQARAIQPLIPPDSVVMEYGCGVGRVLRNIEAKKRIGVDVCPEWLEIAASFGLETAPTDGINITLPSGSVDFIYSLMVFQHCPKENHIAMLKELMRVLSPGGRMEIQFPRKESGYYKASNFVNVYTYAEIQTMMHSAGIEKYTITEWDLAGYADGGSGKREYLLSIEK